MTTINCSLNCIYQQDGLCGRDISAVDSGAISKSPDCVFFKEKPASHENKANGKGELFVNG